MSHRDSDVALARMATVFERYRDRPRPGGLTALDLAYLRGDQANDAFCHLVGWLRGLVDSDVPLTRSRIAEAVEQAVESVLAGSEREV